jgi:hypothetical protein
LIDTKNIEKAIDEYIKDGEDNAFATGWILVASISSASHDIGESDGYVLTSSDGLPHHARLGLLTMALQESQSNSFSSKFLTIFSASENWEDEEEN